jgi:predicted nucleotidyltransferase
MRGYNDYKEILTQFKQLLQEKFGADLISLVLFGSVARGAAKPESDLDMLIILKRAPPVPLCRNVKSLMLAPLQKAH